MKLAVTNTDLIDGEEVQTLAQYDVSLALLEVSLGNLDILQKATKETGFPGITPKLIKATFARLQDEQEALKAEWIASHGDDEDFVGVLGDDLISDPDFRRSIIGLIFLCRRHAGRKETVEDAANLPLSHWRLLPPDEDPEVGADPKDATEPPTDSPPSLTDSPS